MTQVFNKRICKQVTLAMVRHHNPTLEKGPHNSSRNRFGYRSRLDVEGCVWVWISKTRFGFRFGRLGLGLDPHYVLALALSWVWIRNFELDLEGWV